MKVRLTSCLRTRLAPNLIVLSKADLLDDDAEARARATVEARLEAPTPIIPVSGGAAPMDAILGLDMEDQAHARSAHMHHHHDDHHHEDDHDIMTTITTTGMTSSLACHRP